MVGCTECGNDCTLILGCQRIRRAFGLTTGCVGGRLGQIPRDYPGWRAGPRPSMCKRFHSRAVDSRPAPQDERTMLHPQRHHHAIRRPSRGRAPLVCGLLAAALAAAVDARAQEARGTIQGRVVDGSASAVPGAAVDVRNLATGVVTSTVTN